LLAARRGLRTIVAELQSQERIQQTFEHDAEHFVEVELAPRLFTISIDPQHAMEEYLRVKTGPLGQALGSTRLFHAFAMATPGMRELLSIGKVWELAQLERRDRRASPYDLVIVDAPASGHGLALLRAPRTFADIAHVGPIRRRADVIHDFLTDPARTGVVAVALPQEMPVNETLEFREKLHAEMGMDTDVVVMNALLPERFTTEEAERIEAVNGEHGSAEVAAALRAALSEHRRARGQRTQLRRLRKGAPDVVTLPHLFEPELRLEEFEKLSAELERKLA
jgi:anion-transporting  ArsA/GET3 family ATPase